jgi:hypothetical protein
MIKTKNFWLLWFLSLVNGEAVIFVSAFYKVGISRELITTMHVLHVNARMQDQDVLLLKFTLDSSSFRNTNTYVF